MKTKFQTLIFGNKDNFIYVDIRRLHKGIYSCSRPILLNETETLSNINDIYDKVLGKEYKVNFIENLDKCDLIPIEFTLKFD